MFVIMYEFTLTKTARVEFIELWQALTELVNKNSCSYGARLLQANETRLVATAEWPTRDAWEECQLLDPEITDLRERMLKLCDDVQIVYQLDVVKDMLGMGSLN